MELPQILHYIAGPLIGALIGYCTNYIAVKMLFHPNHEVKVLGRTLPFTPGVIPKNNPRLAHAIGETVANVLLTKEDIAGLITDERVDSASTALVAGSGSFNSGIEGEQVSLLSDAGYSFDNHTDFFGMFT